MSIIEFTIPPGVTRAATNKLSPGRWVSTNLVRYRQGVLQPFGGWARMTATPLPGVPRSILGWNSNQDFKYVAVFHTTGIHFLLGDQVTNITPVGYTAPESSVAGGYSAGPYGAEHYGDARSNVDASFGRAPLHCLDSWGDQMIACSSSDGRLLKFDPAVDTIAVPITGDSDLPAGNRGALVTPERFLIAICADGAPRRVSWCDRENYSVWTPTPTNSAGSLELDTHGYLVALGTVKDGTLIWSDTDLFRLRFIGSPLVFGIDKIVEGTTILSPYAHCEFQGKSFWCTREGMMVYEAGTIAPVPCTLLDFFFQDIDPVYGRRVTTCYQNHLFDEIMISYPSVGQTEPDSYICWNFTENTWTLGKLARTCGIPALIDDKPYWCSPDGHVWQHETGTAFTSAGAGEIYAETGALSPGSGQMTQVLKVISDTDLGAASTKWSFFARTTPEGPETAYTDYAPRPDGYIDTRFVCRDVRIRITQNQDGHWTMGKPGADIVMRGKR